MSAYSFTNCAACGNALDASHKCPVCGWQMQPSARSVRCAICGEQAPRTPGYDDGRYAVALVPNPHGWSRTFFPWNEEKMRQGAVVAEQTWLCPKDAAEVAKFIAHRRQPMRTEYENL